MAGHWRINRNRFLQVIRAFRATVLRCSVMSDSLQPRGLLPARLLYPRNSPGKKIGVGCHFLLQGIFPTQELNASLLHWKADSLPLSHLGSPNGKITLSPCVLYNIMYRLCHLLIYVYYVTLIIYIFCVFVCVCVCVSVSNRGLH